VCRRPWISCASGATTDASSELPSDDYTIRLFNSYVFINHRWEIIPEELDQFSNVIKDQRAKLGSMREKNDRKKSSADNEQRLDDPDLSLENSAEPARIDIVAFGRRLGEIITKAVRPSRKRPKSRK
jgi:hypothetical protein